MSARRRRRRRPRVELAQIGIGVIEAFGHGQFLAGSARRLPRTPARAAGSCRSGRTDGRPVGIVAAVREPVVETERSRGRMMSALVSAAAARGSATAPSTPARVASGARRSKASRYSGPAIRIARVVERVHADDDGLGADDLGPRQREREEDRVAGRHVGRRNVARVERAILGDLAVADERRAAEGREVDVELDVPGDAERRADAAGRSTPVRGPARNESSARTVRSPSRARSRGRDESSPPLSSTTARLSLLARTSEAPDQAPVCLEPAAAPSSRSSRIHSASCFGSSTPCTGENSTRRTAPASRARR